MFYRCQNSTQTNKKVQVRVQKERSKRNRRLPWSGAPDCPVCHRTVSGAPGWINSNSSPSGFWKSHSTIIHRTVRCATGATATTQRSTPTETWKALQCADSSRRSQSSARRRTEQWTVTVRWPRLSELQWSNPNGWVTWLVHGTVSGGTPDCPGRPSTAAQPQRLVWWLGLLIPPTTTSSRHPSLHTTHSIQELVQSIQDTIQ
jgi:hypothetical protein